jgi:hemerythrin-like domain-containing protein
VKAIENLLEDHRHIVAVIDAIDMSIMAAAAGQAHLPAFESALAFIQTYADGTHYTKEDRLFAACVAHTIPCAAGPVQCLLMEHEGTRMQTQRMAHAIDGIRAGDDRQWTLLLDAAARNSAITRMHIPKENLGFFPMSELMLPAAVQANLAAEFDDIDRAAGTSIQEAAAGVRRVVASAGQRAGTGRAVSHADIYRLEDARLEGILRAPIEATPATLVVVRRGGRGDARSR